MKKDQNNMTWEELIKACNDLGPDDDFNTIVAKSMLIDSYIANKLNTAEKAAHNAFATNDKNVKAASIWLSELSAKAYGIVAEQNARERK